MRLINGILCCQDGLRKDLDIRIVDGRIQIVPDGDGSDEETLDLKGGYVLPGFIEIHSHGTGLFDFTNGKYDVDTEAFESSEEIYTRELSRYAHLRASTGSTGIYVGSMNAPTEQLKFAHCMLKQYMDGGTNGSDGSLLLGVFLEGSFINPELCGALDPEFCHTPDPALFDDINESGVVRLVNIVPDYGKASCALMEHVSAKGISVGAGHTCATGDQFEEAFSHGLKYFIHLLNGPTGHSYKGFGGSALEKVLQGDIHAEVVCDGVHVDPAYVRDIFARKGYDRVMAVSDSMFFSQAEGVKEYALSGYKGRLSDNGKYAYVLDKEPLRLFGSVLTMDVCFNNILSWLTTDMQGVWYREHPAIPFEQAIGVASRCCSGSIVDMLGLRGGDDLETGDLSDGKWADLVVGDISGEPGEFKLQVKQVYVRGKRVWEVQGQR